MQIIYFYADENYAGKSLSIIELLLIGRNRVNDSLPHKPPPMQKVDLYDTSL